MKISYKKGFSSFIAFCLFIIPFISNAQVIENKVNDSTVSESFVPKRDTANAVNTTELPNIIDTIEIKEPADSLVIKRGKKKEKDAEKKLQTYFLADSLMARRTIVWNLNRYFNHALIGNIDSTMRGNRTELPIYKGNNTGATFLGVTGSSSLNHNYFSRETSDIFMFNNSYSQYFRTPEDVNFYNTKGPYTELAYYSSGNKRISEENLKVIFAQNVTPQFNFGLEYVKLGAKGIYYNQATKNKTFSLFTSYVGKRYVAHAGYLYNSANNNENGGVVDDFYVTDTTMHNDIIGVKLQSAKNFTAQNTYFLTHSYSIPIDIFKRDSVKDGEGTAIFIGHSLEYSRYKHIYSDGPADTAYRNPKISNRYIPYYNNNYLSAKSSYDSTFATRFDNRFFVRLQPFSQKSVISHIDGGLGYNFDGFYMFEPQAYLTGEISNNRLSSGYIYGNGQGVLSKYFAWNAFLRYNFSGYKQNDMFLNASARVSFYPIKGGVHLTGFFIADNREQSYFVNNYFSNHIKWQNNFDKTTETRLGIKLSVPDWQTEAGFNSSLISKQVYFDTASLPQQSSDVLNITGLYVQNNFNVGVLHIDSKLLFQFTTNDNVIPLPFFSGNAAVYLQSSWVKNVLSNQIGFDVNYNSNFYDYAYNPSAGVFHTQNEKKIGNYPWIDLFANFKWKRANIYVKFTNVADGMIGNHNYFSALHYPRNYRMFRIGVNWRFLN